jgi:hypothetical protein
MVALNPAPSIGDTVRVPVQVRRSTQMTSATVKGVTAHTLLVVVNGTHKYVSPGECAR